MEGQAVSAHFHTMIVTSIRSCEHIGRSGNRLRNHTVLTERRKVPKKKKITEKSYGDMPDCVYRSSHYKFHFFFGSCDLVLFGDVAKINIQSIILDMCNSTDSALPHSRF